MSVLPEIGTGRLVTDGVPENAKIRLGDGTKRERKGRKSLLEISQNFQSIRQDEDKKFRSRSFEPSSGDENDAQKSKKAKIDRSKSVGYGENGREPKRKQPGDKTVDYADAKGKSSKRRKSQRQVRFDRSSEESFSKNDHDSRPMLTSSTPKPTGVQYKIGRVKNVDPMETSPISSGQGSPDQLKKAAKQGNHQSRLETSRTRARVWAETASDPGPNYKSIDNDKVIRGQPIDPRRGRVSTDNARTKHAQYMSQEKQDGRPKAADKGRRLQSLPAKKEEHVSETEDRPVISAPSKDQGQMEAPMPKINTLLPSKTNESQPGTSKVSEPSVSPRKEKEHTESQKKREPNDQSSNIQKKEEKERSVSPQKREPIQKSISPQKREPDYKASEPDKKVEEEKNKHVPRPATKVSGVVDRVSEEDGRKSEAKRKLPADDHGPVHPSPKPAQVPKVSSENVSPSDKTFKYYASEKEKEEARKREKATDNSPRVPSEKSTKTDKSWTTIKSKQTDSKQSNSSYPAAPTKSQTAYELSSVDNSEKKRREVTIVDPKYLRKAKKMNDDDDDEPFMHEYEYSHSHVRHRNFKDMDDEEKIEYFRDQLHMKPEQIRELTFHPKVTEPKLIHHAYTGIETINWSSGRIKSGKRPKSRKFSVYKKVTVVPPNQRKSAMLSKLQGVVYRHINKVYGSSPRDVREKQFFEKLAQVQIDDMQRRYEKLAEKERKTLESKFRQREQLRRLRNKFEEDAWRRFMTQYVTSKVVESEYRNRQEYGLPNDLEDRPRRHPQTIRNVHAKHAPYAMTPKRMHRKNEKKYSNLFRFNTGPIPKSGGKPLKFEGFDTVYLDTEDEQDYDAAATGKPTKKKQNVDALMREAKRILDQTDDDDTDLEDTPRKSLPERRPKRTHHYRSRENKHIRDDKSSKSTHTQSTHSKSYNRPPPKTMKELLNRRKAKEVPTNRYKASSFTAMKSDLVKDSDLLNKNERLKKIQSEFPKADNSSKSDSVQTEASKPKSERETGPEIQPVPTIHKTPPASPVSFRTQSPTQQKATTTVQVTSVTTETTTEETGDKKEWKVNDGNVYLDNMETQMAIETARDKIDEARKPSRAPSRASNKVDDKSTNGQPSTKGNVSRAPSRISFRSKQEQTVSKDFRPPRAPSKVSILTSDSKDADGTKTKSHGRHSRASIHPMTADQSPAKSQNLNEKLPNNVSKKTETIFLTETVTESVKNSNSKPSSSQELGRPKEENVPAKSLRDSQVNVKPISRHNSISSVQPQKQISGRTSVVGIASTTGRVSPTVEKQVKAPHTRESYNDKVSDKVKRKESNADKSSVRTVESQNRPTNTKQMNGHVSPARTSSGNDNKGSKTVVSKSVNVSENVSETTHSETKKVKEPVRRQISHEQKQNIDSKDSDLLSTRKASIYDRKEGNSENPKHKGKPAIVSKKGPARRRSRSRTPQRDNSKMNGHDDIKMDRKEYEMMGHDGNRPSRRPASKEQSNRSGRRSTSRGRKASKGRKRSISSERKKGKKASVGKSRFPDIRKKDGQWEIKARSPVQTVSKTESVNEYTTERVITPKPAGANQWKDLVEKYLRQPSPKVGKTDDRSLLDSNIDDDDDDDDMDIFTRAQMKYKLNVDQTDDDDSDAE